VVIRAAGGHNFPEVVTIMMAGGVHITVHRAVEKWAEACG
jgi:hypothetical protein